MAKPTGRPKSGLWKYVTYDKEENQSTCKVTLEDGTVCGHTMNGKWPTNIMKHLDKEHKEIAKEIRELKEKLEAAKESAKLKMTNSSRKQGQLTLEAALSQSNPYSVDSNKYKMITRKVAIFVASANVPNRLVEDPQFKQLLMELDPRYVVPSRTVIMKEIAKVKTAMKEAISKYIRSARKIHITGDIWTKRGMTSSYLGLTAHFVSAQETHKAVLAVRQIFGSHTAENIIDIFVKVLKEWDIPAEKIG